MRHRRMLKRVTIAGAAGMCIAGMAVSTGAGTGPSRDAAALRVHVPVAYQTYQRDAAGVADIPVAGTYDAGADRPPAAVEARFNGGPWRVVDASPDTGTFHGVLAAQPAGQGALEVRFAGRLDVTTRVAYVGIGDIMVGAGDSRAAGRGTRAQSFTHPALVATRFDGAWRSGSDRRPSAGTIYPLISSLHMSEEGVPLATITTGVGSTDLAGSRTQWDPTGDASAYDAMVAAVAAAGVNGVRWVHFMGGPNAIVSPRTPTQRDVEAALRRFAARVAADLPGAPTVVADVFGECGTGTPPDRRQAQDNYRRAVIALAEEGIVRLGAVLVDQDYRDDVHPESDAALREGAGRAWLALHDAMTGGDEGRGPRLVSATLDDARTQIRVSVDRDLARGTVFGGFRVEIDGVAVPVEARRVSSRRILVTMSRPAGDASAVTIAFASDDDAVGAVVPTSTRVELPDGTSVVLPMEPARVRVTRRPTGRGKVHGDW